MSYEIDIIVDFDLSKKQLTGRENQLVILMARGFSIQEIADELYISKFTVMSHRKSIYKKLGVKKLIHVGVYAEREGLLKGEKLNLR